MVTDMNSYALQLVNVQNFACLCDLEERRDLVSWVLKNEYPHATDDERYTVMMSVLPALDVLDFIAIEDGGFPW